MTVRLGPSSLHEYACLLFGTIAHVAGRWSRKKEVRHVDVWLLMLWYNEGGSCNIKAGFASWFAVQGSAFRVSWNVGTGVELAGCGSASVQKPGNLALRAFVRNVLQLTHWPLQRRRTSTSQ